MEIYEYSLSVSSPRWDSRSRLDSFLLSARGARVRDDATLSNRRERNWPRSAEPRWRQETHEIWWR